MKSKPVKKIHRMVSLLITLLFWGLSFIFFIFAYAGLKELYGFSDIIYFQNGDVVLLIISLMCAMISIITICSFITGEQANDKIMGPICGLIVLLFFVFLISRPITGIYFTNLLEKNGYIECPRTNGSSPIGGGRTWARSAELCKQKQHTN